MHTQALVIYPKDTELTDVMYPYQEVDKYPHEKISDDRCQFFLSATEDKTPEILDEIRKYLEKSKNKSLEVSQYRSEHSYMECKEKYGKGYTDNCFRWYVHYSIELNKFNKIKDYPINSPEIITYIKEWAGWATENVYDIYIPGKGYGFFHNPYEIWDYYGIVNEMRFPSHVTFLIGKNDTRDNQMNLAELDVNKTINNIRQLTRVWEYIIFCKDDPSDSRLYTIDDIRFDDEWNKHCLVDNLEDVLTEIQGRSDNSNYIVTAIDYHW